ncbi:MAG: cell division protein ZapA [Acutalibacteraceae bacterium]|nr:cell division protein ZapA [Acutalibacteraceae bacterium]
MSEEKKKNKLRLKIAGSQFVISADESEQYIQKIAKMVDDRIRYLDDSDTKMSLHMATIVAALNYCDQLEKERIITRELIKKTEECEAIARDASLQLNKLLKENAELKEEKAGLHKVISELKTGTYIEEETINEKQNKSEASDTHSQKVSSEAIINSIKTTPAKLNSIKGVTENKNSFPKTSVPMTDHIYESEKYANTVTDEEIFNLKNKKG